MLWHIMSQVVFRTQVWTTQKIGGTPPMTYDKSQSGKKVHVCPHQTVNVDSIHYEWNAFDTCAATSLVY